MIFSPLIKGAYLLWNFNILFFSFIKFENLIFIYILLTLKIYIRILNFVPEDQIWVI